MPNASVLPDPVGARPDTSRPASAAGIVPDWTGNASVMPRAASEAVIWSGTPSSANVGGADERAAALDGWGSTGMGNALPGPPVRTLRGNEGGDPHRARAPGSSPRPRKPGD